MTNQDAIELLIKTGFDYGWVIKDGQLVLWEHDEAPPAPLTRPEPQV